MNKPKHRLCIDWRNAQWYYSYSTLRPRTIGLAVTFNY